MRERSTRWLDRVRNRWNRGLVRNRSDAAYAQGREDERAAQSFESGLDPTTILIMGLVLLLFLLLLAAWQGWIPGLNFGANAETVPTAVTTAEVAQTSVALPTVGVPPPTVFPVDARFQQFYEANGGLPVLGLPLSPVLNSNGRDFQWFERARLEYWPEFAGTPYEIQFGRLGSEYTTGIDFPAQPFVVSTPDRVYFRETGHSVGGGFLRYWQNNGGLRVFGYPISDELRQTINGTTYTVQYFERARLEWHADQPPPNDIQMGLLGRALYLAEARPPLEQPVR
jgi:hypothetical protein